MNHTELIDYITNSGMKTPAVPCMAGQLFKGSADAGLCSLFVFYHGDEAVISIPKYDEYLRIPLSNVSREKFAEFHKKISGMLFQLQRDTEEMKAKIHALELRVHDDISSLLDNTVCNTKV